MEWHSNYWCILWHVNVWLELHYLLVPVVMMNSALAVSVVVRFASRVCLRTCLQFHCALQRSVLHCSQFAVFSSPSLRVSFFFLRVDVLFSVMGAWVGAGFGRWGLWLGCRYGRFWGTQPPCATQALRLLSTK